MRSDRLNARNFLQFAMPPLAVTALLMLLRQEPPNWVQALSALALACAPWWSYLNWRDSKTVSSPLFAMIAASFWLYYCLSFFLGEQSIRMWQILDIGLSDGAVTQALAMAAVGVICLWLGMRSGVGRRLLPSFTLDIANNPNGLQYVRGVLVLTTFFGLFESAPALLGASGRQLILYLQTFVPMVAFAYLLAMHLRGRSTAADRALLVGFLLVRLMVGISSGWVGSVANLFLVSGLVYFSERRRVPIAPLVLISLSFLFLQAGKEDFRRTYWYGSGGGGRIERVLFWLESSTGAWVDAIHDPTGASLRAVFLRSLSRVSLLSQTANVVELTPEVVPYQGFQMYSYMAVTLIPRAIWPEKPSVNEANRFYQVAFGMTQEEDLEGVSIAVGFLTEAYISFGWWGIVVVLTLSGVLLDFFRGGFLFSDSGLLFRSIGFALMFGFLGIERQFAQYFGGIVQQIAVVVLLMLPVLRIFPRATRSVPQNWPTRSVQVGS